MEEEFYAAIKLVSGEEIFSKVCPCEEEDETILILDNPVIIETISIKQLGINGVKLHPWMKLSNDSMFIINMDKVITITEVTDQSTIKIHKKFVREKDRVSGLTEITPNMGYLSTISEARVSLEKIYKSN
jgi:hypothetical protein